MKILVCISKVPDTTSKIDFVDDGKNFNSSGINFIMNPYDEWYALVRGLELKETLGGTVTVLNVGPADNDVVIRKGLALGADDAVRIDAEPKDSLFTAKQIANHCQGKGYDLILMGKETIDYNGNEVPAMVAEILDLPFVSYASHLDVAGSVSTVTRDIEGGVEVVEVDGPLVISAAKGLAEQRIANMRGIMMSKRKPLNTEGAVDSETLTSVSSHQLPPAKAGVKLIDPDNMDELVRLLQEEAKVI